MAKDLTAFEDWIEPLLRSISQGERRQLTRRLATGLRRRQADRIRAQQNPDGSAYAPRRPRPRKSEKTGRIRRQKAMFAKLRQTRHLKTTSDADGLAVGYQGRAARIARIHQEGLVARVAPGGPLFRYPVRQILGFSEDDRLWIVEQLQQQLAGR